MDQRGLARAIEANDFTELAMLLGRGAKSEGGLYLAASLGHSDILQLLLDANAVIDLPDSDSRTALFAACLKGRSDCVQLLLAAQAIVDMPDNSGATPLHAACFSGHGSCVQLLLAARAATDRPANNGATPLHTACLRGFGGSAKLLLAARAAVDHRDNDGATTLFTACNYGHVDCVQLLLTAHAATDQPTIGGGTCLLIACSQGYGDCVQLLLAAHVIVDTPDKSGATPLHAACFSGHGSCVQLLLAGHAAVDQPDEIGLTPLHTTCNEDQGDCLQLLLAARAALNPPDSDGDTPLHIASGVGHGDCVQLLLAAHADIDRLNNMSGTPLRVACQQGNAGCVQQLLAAHATVHQADCAGVTPLYVACIEGRGDCVLLLLDTHAAVDQADNNGTTPLQAACAKGSLDIVKQLVEAGARTDGRLNKTFTGGTALRVAEAAGHTTIVSFLRGHRRAPAPAAAASVSAEERVAAERNAELAAAALLAEEADDEAKKKQAQQKKASKKSKAKMGANADSGGAADRAKAVAVTEAAVAAEPAAVATADEALRRAMALAQYEALARALEEHCTQASEGVLTEARALRERLHKKHKKESQKLRRAHAVEMEVLSGISSLALTDASPQLPQAATAAAPAAAASPPAAALLPAPAVALTLAELAAATGGFGEQKLIGSGGYGRVFSADALPSLPPEALPPRLRHLPIAVKRAKSGTHNLADLQREVSVLQQCNHPHLLPLLGYYLEPESPCLVFPLMRGGSFADRLCPSKADPKHLSRLGLSVLLRPLQWRERLVVLRQATDALLYLHTISVIHRDFKPENILLDDDENAFLADTGFAKMESTGPEAGKQQKSASNVFYLTMGYLDPSIVSGGKYSAATDGWALGITMLVALTNRSPLQIFEECEDQFDDDFEAIDAIELVDVEASWPQHVATTIKDLVRSEQKGLCHNKSRKRLAVADVLASLTSLAGDSSSGGSCSSVVESPAVSLNTSAPSKEPLSSDQPYEPTPLSMQVRETRKGGDAQKRIQDNMLLAFSNLMPRFDTVYAAAVAPEGFEERINFWHRECGMRSELRVRLHSLRVWANAARHHNAERWRRDGPRSEEEASNLVAAVKTELEVLER